MRVKHAHHVGERRKHLWRKHSKCLSKRKKHSISVSSLSFYRNRAMTESPRRPPMSELSRTGYSSCASPDNRLSKRLGASLPNLEQPANDTVTIVRSNRPASLRKMTPDIGQYWWRKEIHGELADLRKSVKNCFWSPLSPFRVEVSSESGEGFPPPGVPPSIGLSLCPELLFWHGCFPGEGYKRYTTWRVCSAGQVLWGEETDRKWRTCFCTRKLFLILLLFCWSNADTVY